MTESSMTQPTPPEPETIRTATPPRNPSHPPRDPTEIRKRRAAKHQERIKLANVYANAFEAAAFDSVAYKLRSCHQKEILACCSTCHGAWYVLDKCRLRICPICSRNVFIERARYIKACCKQAKFPKLITLTQPLVTGDPREGITQLKKWFSKLREHEIFSNVRGGAYTIEVIPKTEGWHIHIHALVDAPYIPHEKLWSTWKQITQNEVPQTDIRAAKTPQAMEYVAKYASKSASMYLKNDTIVDYYNAVHGFRLFVTFGCWFNAKLEDLDPDYHPFIPESICPCCGEKKSTFRARDGPVIFGREFWEAAATTFLHSLPESRPFIDPQNETGQVE